MVTINFSENLKLSYNKSIFGSLVIKNVPNKKGNHFLKEKKESLQKLLRKEDKILPEEKVLNLYKNHFKIWNRTYPIEFQIQSIIKGKNLPNVSVLVDSMFHAEIKNKILSSFQYINILSKITYAKTTY